MKEYKIKWKKKRPRGVEEGKGVETNTAPGGGFNKSMAGGNKKGATI